MGQEEPKFKIDINEGTVVKVIDGPFKGFEGKVINVDEAHGKVKVLCAMFGRETPIELDFLQIQKV
jgi:transcriptional antiterminator NusG